VSQSRKLGLKDESVVALIDAPTEFQLADPPPGCTVERVRSTHKRELARVRRADVAIAFARSRHDLSDLADALASYSSSLAPLWLCWPRRAGRHISDLSDELVRAAGLSLGLVDTKVAALDADWSSLRFSSRRT
jgi:hypothetical protein